MSANDTSRRPAPAVPAQPTRRPPSRNQRQVSEAGYLMMHNEEPELNEETSVGGASHRGKQAAAGGAQLHRGQRPIKKPAMRGAHAISLDQQPINDHRGAKTLSAKPTSTVSKTTNTTASSAGTSTTNSETPAQPSGVRTRQQVPQHQQPQQSKSMGSTRSESKQHLTADMDDGSCIVDDINDDEVIAATLDDELGEDGGPGGPGGQLGRAASTLSSAGLTKNLVWAVFASAVGSSFQHGYNGGVVNAPERLIGQFVNATYMKRHGEAATEAQVDLIIAIIVSIFCIGGCLGALLTALVADRVGRKEGLMYNNILVLVAAPMMASSKSMSSYELLILGRFLIGINAGLNAGLAPLYLNEIAPIKLRGALGTIYQLVITISILLSNIFGLPSLLGDEHSWPFLFAIPVLPAAFMLAALPHCCESPKHLLLNQGRELQAQQALAWFRQTGDVQEEMDELHGERELNIINNRTITLADMLSEQSLRKPLTIAIVIMLSQQLSGINAVLFFSTSIFRDAGLGEQSAVRATLGMSIVNVGMTLVSLFLVDRAGRRTLHMTGLMGMAATCLVLAVCLQGTGGGYSQQQLDETSALSSGVAVVAVYVFIAMFASGPGAIPWFLVAELFPSNARPLASSIAVAVNWLANFTVSLCFLPLSNLLHGFTFVLFAILLVIFYLFTYYKVPETKGATAEEISALFKR